MARVARTSRRRTRPPAVAAASGRAPAVSVVPADCIRLWKAGSHTAWRRDRWLVPDAVDQDSCTASVAARTIRHRRPGPAHSRGTWARGLTARPTMIVGPMPIRAAILGASSAPAKPPVPPAPMIEPNAVGDASSPPGCSRIP
ncbi:hypothetical protein [Streptomyces achromogenes]|uniref:hypothetical protein n=1 Tax=Streptomyces achromogenes TaxID=67255 RepID=UPI0037014FCE